MPFFLTWLVGGLELSFVYKPGSFLHCISSGTFPSVSVRVLILLTLKQGHCGEINDNLWWVKGNQQVMVANLGLATAGSEPLQPGQEEK